MKAPTEGRAALIALLFLAVACPGLEAQSRPAPSQPLWSGSTRASTFVTMADGTRLAVDWWLPTGWKGPRTAPTRFPVVFRYSPYTRSYLDPA